jgi:hypothetical protein
MSVSGCSMWLPMWVFEGADFTMACLAVLRERRTRRAQGTLEPFPFRLNRNGGLQLVVLTRFLHENRYPLGSKTL